MEASEISTVAGTISFSGQVFAYVARRAAISVKEIAALDSRFSNTISHAVGMETVRGVHVSFDESEVSIDLYILVYHGCRIPEVALKVQEQVKDAVLKETRVPVSAVNVYVQGVIFPKGTKAVKS